MNCIVAVAVNICTGVYICVGIFGYIAFCYKPFTGNILLSFTPSMTSSVIKLGFILSLAFSFPLVIFPCRASLYSFIYKVSYSMHDSGGDYIPEGKFKALTFTIVSISLTIGILIPNIEIVLGLVGSTIGVMICVLFPVVCFICVSQKKTNERHVAQLILFMGVVIMVLSTYANLYAVEHVKPNIVKIPFENQLARDRYNKLEDKVRFPTKKAVIEPIKVKDVKKTAKFNKKTKDEQKIDIIKEIRHEPPQPEEPKEEKQKPPEPPQPVIKVTEELKEVISEVKVEKPLVKDVAAESNDVINKQVDTEKEIRHEPPQPEEPREEKQKSLEPLKPIIKEKEELKENILEVKADKPVVKGVEEGDDLIKEQLGNEKRKQNNQKINTETQKKKVITEDLVSDKKETVKKVVDVAKNIIESNINKQNKTVVNEEKLILEDLNKIEKKIKDNVETLNKLAEDANIIPNVQSNDNSNLNKNISQKEITHKDDVIKELKSNVDNYKKDEVDIEAIKKEENELKEQENVEDKKANMLIETLRKQNEVQQEIVQQQKKFYEVIKNQENMNELKLEAVRKIENIAKQAIEQISGKDKESEVSNKTIKSDSKVEGTKNNENSRLSDVPLVSRLGPKGQIRNETLSLNQTKSRGNILPLPLIISNAVNRVQKPNKTESSGEMQNDTLIIKNKNSKTKEDEIEMPPVKNVVNKKNEENVNLEDKNNIRRDILADYVHREKRDVEQTNEMLKPSNRTYLNQENNISASKDEYCIKEDNKQSEKYLHNEVEDLRSKEPKSLELSSKTNIRKTVSEINININKGIQLPALLSRQTEVEKANLIETFPVKLQTRDLKQIKEP